MQYEQAGPALLQQQKNDENSVINRFLFRFERTSQALLFTYWPIFNTDFNSLYFTTKLGETVAIPTSIQQASLIHFYLTSCNQTLVLVEQRWKISLRCF